MTEPATRARAGRANWILSGLIAAFGAVVFGLTVRAGRADSALLFVALPALLAAALALTPGRTTHGQVFRITTIALLLTAVALHEGAICVVLAAPLVYAVAHCTAAVVRLMDRPDRRALALPLVLLVGLEGGVEQWRAHPEQTVTITRTVALTPEQVRARLAAGPAPAPARSVALRALDVPLPRHIAGGGLEPGDSWVFSYHGGSHGPGGHTVTEVRVAEADRLTFRVVEDTAITARWFGWRDATVSWTAAEDDRTVVRLTLGFRRGLDPSWYFGPLQDRLLHAGGEHLLDMLALR